MDLKEECLALVPKLLTESNSSTQIAIAIEEMSELTKALIKNNFRDKDNTNDVFEELGDVLFCVSMIMHIYKTNEQEIFTILYKKLHDRELLEKNSAYDAYINNDVITAYCYGVDNDIENNNPNIERKYYDDIIMNDVITSYYRDGQLIKTTRNKFEYLVCEYYRDDRLIQIAHKNHDDGSIIYIGLEDK